MSRSREKQGYKSDVTLKEGIHLVVSWENIPLILTYNNLQVTIESTKPFVVGMLVTFFSVLLVIIASRYQTFAYLNCV